MGRGVYLSDKNQELLTYVNADRIQEDTQELELADQIAAKAKLPYLNPKDVSCFGAEEENNFWVYKVRKIEESNEYLTLDGIYVFFDDLEGHVIRDIRSQDTIGNLVVEKIIADTDWILGANDVTRRTSKNFYYQLALSAFYDAIRVWNFEFKPTIKFKDSQIIKKGIDIYDQINVDHGKWLEYGDKLLAVIPGFSMDNLYTAFISRGKGIE